MPMFRSQSQPDSAAAFAAAPELPIAAWKERILDRVRLDHAPRTIRLHVGLDFVAMAALLGVRHGFVGAVLTLLVLSSVLLTQEFPRALIARAFGCSSSIVISASGGHIEFGGEPLHGAPAIATAVAGSVANALVACAAFALAQSTHGAPSFFRALAFSHVVWGGMQLLPVLPSRLGMAIADGRSPRARVGYAIASLIVTATIGSVLATESDSVLIFAFACLWVIACGRQASQLAREAADANAGIDAAVAEAHARLEADDSSGAIELLRWGLGVARSHRQRGLLSSSLARAAIAHDDRRLLRESLRELPADHIDLALLASALVCWDRDEEARLLLERARALGQRSRETTKLLIDVQLRRGEPEAALSIARADAALLTEAERVAVATALAERI